MADVDNRYYSIATVTNWTEHYTPTDLINAYHGIYVSETVDADTVVNFLHVNRVSPINRFTYIILDFALTLDTINDIIDRGGHLDYQWIIVVTETEFNSHYNRENVTQAIECMNIGEVVQYSGKNYVFYTPGGGGAQRSLIQYANGTIIDNSGGNGADIAGGGSQNLVPPRNACRLITGQNNIYRGIRLFNFDNEANAG